MLFSIPIAFLLSSVYKETQQQQDWFGQFNLHWMHPSYSLTIDYFSDHFIVPVLRFKPEKLLTIAYFLVVLLPVKAQKPL